MPPAKLKDWNVTDWTRARPDEQFAVGQAVRLHFEPLTGAGYLYIVHQELYANDATGRPVYCSPHSGLTKGTIWRDPTSISGFRARHPTFT